MESKKLIVNINIVWSYRFAMWSGETSTANKLAELDIGEIKHVKLDLSWRTVCQRPAQTSKQQTDKNAAGDAAVVGQSSGGD